MRVEMKHATGTEDGGEALHILGPFGRPVDGRRGWPNHRLSAREWHEASLTTRR